MALLLFAREVSQRFDQATLLAFYPLSFFFSKAEDNPSLMGSLLIDHSFSYPISH